MKVVLSTKLQFDNLSIGKEFFEHYKIPYTVLTAYIGDKEYTYYRAEAIDVSRFDKRLIEFIENVHGGEWHDLKVVEVPDGKKYFIYGVCEEKIITEDWMPTARSEVNV